ncbi:epididymal-specific lipocalin-6 isoform X4 [Sciurus carolinensis]|uniref:epididymal-specific lipocalin-6 isoform X4 n=1 Tax=Sciurus carolinensis TaxID=30640 RepID=UPI001FB3FBA2|nr:epididymal-specific lipocalin-6 isoform X4 [Sciurus carolinensis]
MLPCGQWPPTSQHSESYKCSPAGRRHVLVCGVWWAGTLGRMRVVLLGTLLLLVSVPSAQLVWLGRLDPKQLLGPWYVLAVSSQEKGFMVEKSTKNVEGVMVTLTAEQNLKLLSSRHGLEGCIQSTMELSKQNSRWVFENPLPGAGHQLQRLRHHPDPAGARGGGLQHAGAVQSDGDGQPGSPATLHQVEQGPGLPVPAAGPATEGFHLCTQDHPAELPTGEAVATCDWEDLRPACWPRLCKAVAEGAHSGKLAPVLILLPGSGSAQDGLPSHQPRIKDAISKRAQCILTGARPCSCQAGSQGSGTFLRWPLMPRASCRPQTRGSWGHLW